MSRAVIYEQFGSPEVLELREVPEPHAGAAVIGTASPSTFAFLRQLGAEPVAYGAGLADRVRMLAPGGVTAATDLFGTETAAAALALALGVPPERISTIAAGPNPPGGVRATGGIDAAPDALEQITDAILAGQLTVPLAASHAVTAAPASGKPGRPRPA
jgi:NADPH:quinone reductase-like Zn-dependent oxidoreductase